MVKIKALILAADHKNSIPSCFNLTVGFVNLLEYHLKLLKLLGFKSKEICIVAGKNEKWQSLYTQIDSKYKLFKIDNLNKRSFISLKNFCEEEFDNLSDSLLILNANCFFELKDLSNLLENKNPKALSFMINNTNYQSLELINQNNKIAKINKKPNKIPYLSYAGALFLNKEQITKIKNFKKCPNKAYIDVLVNDLKFNLEAVKLWKHSANSSLIGGSYAGCSKLHLVKKEAEQMGNEKLINEINWINALPQNLKANFPNILEYQCGESNTWYLMPFYDLENLREKILSGKFSSEQALYFIDKILHFSFTNLNHKRSKEVPKDYLFKKYFNRVLQRMEALENITPYNTILKAKHIIINQKIYPNLKELINKLIAFEEESGFFTPKELVMAHGDLHFQNILIDELNDNFILLDPRGDAWLDIYYDLGKIWHSCNGLYDFIHTELSEMTILKQDNDSIEFNFTLSDDKELIKTYENIKNAIIKLLETKFAKELNDQNWLLKTLFAEAMHFASLMHFHLKYDGIENRSVCLYLQSIILCDYLLANLQGIKTHTGGGGG